MSSKRGPSAFILVLSTSIELNPPVVGPLVGPLWGVEDLASFSLGLVGDTKADESGSGRKLLLIRTRA